MEDIIKSGLLAIVLLMTLVVSAPLLDDGIVEKSIVDVSSQETIKEKDIHIPM